MVPIRNPLCSSLIRSASDCVLSDKETEKESMEQVLAWGRNLWHQKPYWATLNAGQLAEQCTTGNWWCCLLVMSMLLVMLMVLSGGDLAVASFVLLRWAYAAHRHMRRMLHANVIKISAGTHSAYPCSGIPWKEDKNLTILIGKCSEIVLILPLNFCINLKHIIFIYSRQWKSW